MASEKRKADAPITIDSKKCRHAIDTLAEEFVCPITQELPLDPVTAEDGRSYERANIERWLAESRLSPVTGSQLPHGYLTPNHALRNAIQEWVAQQEDQPKPAAEEAFDPKQAEEDFEEEAYDADDVNWWADDDEEGLTRAAAPYL